MTSFILNFPKIDRKTLKVAQLWPMKKLDLVKFSMCTLVSRDCVPFCKYIKRLVYPTHENLTISKKILKWTIAILVVYMTRKLAQNNLFCICWEKFLAVCPEESCWFIDKSTQLHMSVLQKSRNRKRNFNAKAGFKSCLGIDPSWKSSLHFSLFATFSNMITSWTWRHFDTVQKAY